MIRATKAHVGRAVVWTPTLPRDATPEAGIIADVNENWVLVQFPDQPHPEAICRETLAWKK